MTTAKTLVKSTNLRTLPLNPKRNDHLGHAVPFIGSSCAQRTSTHFSLNTNSLRIGTLYSIL